MLTTMLRRRSVDSPTTSWPSQAAPSHETDEEMRERLGVAPLATMAFASVSLPATSYDLRAATALQQRDSDAAVADHPKKFSHSPVISSTLHNKPNLPK